jgi:hypothetical protein
MSRRLAIPREAARHGRRGKRDYSFIQSAAFQPPEALSLAREAGAERQVRHRSVWRILPRQTSGFSQRSKKVSLQSDPVHGQASRLQCCMPAELLSDPKIVRLTSVNFCKCSCVTLVGAASGAPFVRTSFRTGQSCVTADWNGHRDCAQRRARRCRLGGWRTVDVTPRMARHQPDSAWARRGRLSSIR